DERRGETHRLLLMDLPSHDLPTPDVLGQVEVVEGSTQSGPKVGDVPGPDLVRSCGGEDRNVSGRWGPRGLPENELPLLAEETIERGLGGEVATLIGKARNDLARRKVSKFLGVYELKYLATLGLGQLVSGN